jgi:ketosteroid isomerase-like protein
MHKAIPLTVAAVAALCVTGCIKGAKAATDPAQVEQAIRAQEAQWQKDYAAKDVNALAGHYADDAELGDIDAAVVNNDVDRRKELQSLISDPNLKLSFAADRVDVAQAGDIAVSRGHYAITTTDTKTNKPVDSRGSYLTVYKKQADGSWKATEDFITPGPAPAAAKK